MQLASLIRSNRQSAAGGRVEIGGEPPVILFTGLVQPSLPFHLAVTEGTAHAGGQVSDLFLSVPLD